MFEDMIKQQLLGTIHLSVLLVLVYSLFPQFFFSMLGVMFCSLAIGIYVAYLGYKASKKTAKGLKFTPSAEYKSHFDTEIARCDLRPEEVNVRYAYVNDAIAITIFNTIAIDPIFWKEMEGDEEFLKAKNIVETQIIPGVSKDQEILYAHIKEIVTPVVQKFIFRHELGHIFHNYASKRIVLTGIIGAVSTAVGIGIAYVTISGGIIALLLGWLAGSSVDLIFTYLSNLFFQVRQEVKADMFAVKFSSNEEINAAADFFEQYGKYAQEYRNSIGGLLAIMPPALLTGHCNGQTRARYLRDSISIQ